MGFVILALLSSLYIVSIECATHCNDTAQMLNEVFDCFPKEFVDLQSKGMDVFGKHNLSHTIAVLGEDDGYKLFYHDYKAMVKGCKKSTPKNAITCYQSIMKNCEINISKAVIDDLYERYEALCSNAEYLSEQQCCLEQSYVYQTPCYRSEFVKLRSSLGGVEPAEKSAGTVCSFQTCTFGCTKQALRIAKCDTKLVDVMSALFKPMPSACRGVPENTTFDCSESKYLDNDLTCKASTFFLSFPVTVCTALSVLIYLCGA